MIGKPRKHETRLKLVKGRKRLAERGREREHKRTEISKSIIWLGTGMGEV